MADALQIANQRRQNYKDAIAQKEAEIAELRNLISELDDFIEFGDALVSNGPSAKPAQSEPDAVGPVTPKETEARSDDKPAPMSAADNRQNLARVISRRTG